MNVFVTDGDERPALAITRALGRRGIGVVVGEARTGSLSSASRYCVRQVAYPSPYADPDGFDRFLIRFVRDAGIDVVIPVTDVTTAAVARHQDALRPHARVAVPPFDAFDLVTDKSRLLRRAQDCGVAIPRTLFVDDGSSVSSLLKDVRFPAVVKPARSKVQTAAGWVSTQVRYAHDISELTRLYRTMPYLASSPSLIQERVDGPGIGVFALFEHGTVRATFAHRRLREKPPSGGVSVLCESVAFRPDLGDEAVRLLGSLNWHGVAMLEYKLDSASGRAVLMEVNGRFWGSLQLAVDAGVDFPYLTWQLALGGPVDAPGHYQVGVRSRWLLGDLDHLLLRLSHRSRDLPSGSPSRLGSVIDFFRWMAPAERSDVFRSDDPRPAFAELRSYVSAFFRQSQV